MRVFAETNFLLTLAFDQRGAEHVARLLAEAEAGRIDLLLPAFSVAEAYRTLRDRQKRSEALRRDLDRRTAKLLESRGFRAESAADLRRLQRSLTKQSLRQAAALRRLVERLEDRDLIPLTAEVVIAGRRLEMATGLDPLDATVLASVESVTGPPANLPDHDGGDAGENRDLFVTTNASDFDRPAIRERLAARGVDLLTGFGSAAGRLGLTSAVGPPREP